MMNEIEKMREARLMGGWCTNQIVFSNGCDALSLAASLYRKPPQLGDGIKDVIFNNPATIILWRDGTKTVVKAEGERFDPEKGFAMAIAKKAFGNEGNYYNVFKKWLPEKKDEKLDVAALSYTIDSALKGIRAATKNLDLSLKRGDK